MLTIRTILVPTDYSACSLQALCPAAELAARYGARILVVHAVEPGEPQSHRLRPLRWEDVTCDLPLPAGAAPPHGRIHVERIVAADPAPALLDYAREHDADLILMGTHGRRGFRRFLVGSVAGEVMRTADRPVLAVPCRQLWRGERVLVPVDFSDGSRAALRYGKALAAERGVGLDVLHVVEMPPALAVPGVGGGDSPAAALLDGTRALLDRFVAETPGPAVDTAARVLVGSPVHRIAHYAEEAGTGLIVVSTHGWTGFNRLVMGSVAERVVRMAACPVLTVRAWGRSLLEEPGGEAEAATPSTEHLQPA